MNYSHLRARDAAHFCPLNRPRIHFQRELIELNSEDQYDRCFHVELVIRLDLFYFPPFDLVSRRDLILSYSFLELKRRISHSL